MMPKMGSVEQFARFRAVVLSDPALERRLQAAPDWPSFVEDAIRAGSEHGVALREADLVAARNEAARAWLERWV